MALQKSEKSVAGGNVSVQTRRPLASASVGMQPLTFADVFKPRLIICSSGHQKRGKTHFALTAPDPIGYFSFHKGLEGVGQKFINKKDIRISHYEWERPTKSDPTDQVQKSCSSLLARFESDFDWAVNNCRTLVIDDGTDLWSILRLANFGKLTANALNFGDLNAIFLQWIRRVQSGDNNFIMLHKVKEEWEQYTDSTGKTKGRTTGRYVRDGYRGAEYDAHVSIVHDRDYSPEDKNPLIATGPFYFQVYDCRQEPGLVGQMFIQGQEPMDCAFMDLAKMCYPESDEKDWK